MYFKSSLRPHPVTNQLSGYYRLVESYRNADNRICHRTIVNVGFCENLTLEQFRQIQTILTEKVKHNPKSLFNLPASSDPVVIDYVTKLYNEMVSKKRIDILQDNLDKKGLAQGKDIQRIDVNSIKNKDVREIGAEWLSYQAVEQLNIASFLKDKNWSDEETQLALTHIISRAVYPASELETTRWIKENSAICEVTGYDIERVTKDKLYGIAKKLYSVKDDLEQHLSHRTNHLFDIEDKIVFYDLTNTYFEGRKKDSELAKFGRSKEKRSDAKLVVLGLVVNAEGFIKNSSILEGNMSDAASLEGMINKLGVRTSPSQKVLVVFDAGIATEENLKLVANKGFDYLCVSRSDLKSYKCDADVPLVTITDNKKQKITLSKVKSEKNTDYYLKVNSEAKMLKECSMNEQFKVRFEEELVKISDSLSKKGGVKQEDKVYERLGRAKQKYPSIYRHFDIVVNVQEEILPVKKRSIKDEIKPQEKSARIVKSIHWSVKKAVEINERSGIYFLRTSLDSTKEATLWQCYNTIREIEATFRVLKTDLDLRPIYHKNDDTTMAHLHLGLLAYWVVNTVRHQLKAKKINHGWREIVRIMNTQKAVTTTAQNEAESVIQIRRCTDPNPNAKQLYDALKFKYAPFTRKKSVVHKSST